MRSSRLGIWALGTIVATALGGADRALGGCDLKITSVQTCDTTGKPATLKVGNPYSIRVDWTVTGTPSRAYGVKFTIANQTWTRAGNTASSGSFWLYWGQTLPLDQAVPYTVTLDPDKVSGDTNWTNNTASGTINPTPPTAAIEKFNPKRYRATQQRNLNISATTSTVKATMWLGVPTTDSFQTILSTSPPNGSVVATTAPNSRPVYAITWGPTRLPSGASWSMTQGWTMEQSSVRVNPTSLKAVTWSDLTPSKLSSDVRIWLNPSATVQSTDSRITAFVARSLPSNYRTTLTPYDAARKLHQAVVAEMSYTLGATRASAVDALLAKNGDCGSYAALLVASLRNIGIPARGLCGWWVTNEWHCVLDFYLPGKGWIPADPTSAELHFDSSGANAYCFGYVPDMNKFCFVSMGDAFQIGDLSVSGVAGIQTGVWWWWWQNGSVPSITYNVSITTTPL